MTQAGELKHRIAFDKRTAVDDGYGNKVSGPFTEQFVVAAAMQARFGGESVMAARLTGQQPVTFTVRRSAQTRLVAPDWQVRDVRTGVVYAIRSIADPDDASTWLEILCQSGVAS
jgi:head-tail adaptor